MALSHINKNLLTETCELEFMIVKNCFCLFIYVPVNSYGHVRMLAVERDVFKNEAVNPTNKFLFVIKSRLCLFMSGIFA